MRFNNTIPFEDLYQPALKEASRKKPVFFIHKYFARRITANFRTALLDYIYDDDTLLQHFYEPSCNKGEGLTVLDPFMGGGTTVFEALRFGCSVIGNESPCKKIFFNIFRKFFYKIFVKISIHLSNPCYMKIKILFMWIVLYYLYFSYFT